VTSQLIPICGYLRSVGPEKVVNVCFRQPDHRGQHHLMPWTQYTQDYAERMGEDRPWWMDALAEAVQAMNRQAFREAVEQQRADDARQTEDEGRPPLPDDSDPEHVKEEKFRAREQWERDHQPPQVVPTLGGDPDLQPGYVPPGIDPEHVRQWERDKQDEAAQREQDETTGQCQAVRRDPADHEEISLQQCGRPAGHPEDDRPTLGGHDEWVDVSGQGLGRSQGDTWQQVTESDPEAWRPPEESDRAATPPPGGPIPGGVSGEQLSPPGRTAEGPTKIKFQPPARGEGGRPVATVGELKAIASRMKEEFEALRGQADQARNIVQRLGAEAQNVLSESSQETAQAVIASSYAAETALDDVVSNVGNAIENLERFIASA
jgi:hypothetical protein